MVSNVIDDNTVQIFGGMMLHKISYVPVRPSGYTNGVKDIDGDYNAAYY